jgi:membrane-associated protein
VWLEGVLAAHGGLLILPLAAIEGPIVSVIAGILAARGDLAWYWALCLLVAGDVIGDLAYYTIGRTGKAQLGFVGRLFGMRRAFTPELQNRLHDHSTKMLLVGKWTHSLGAVVLIGSGMLRINLARFMAVNFLATIPKSAVLLAFGYFASGYLPFFQKHVVLATLSLGAAGAAVALLILRSRHRHPAVADAGQR